jgi:hypothetical protein
MRLTNVFEAEYPGWFRVEPALFPNTPDSMVRPLCGRTIIASQRIIEAKFDTEKALQRFRNAVMASGLGCSNSFSNSE